MSMWQRAHRLPTRQRCGSQRRGNVCCATTTLRFQIVEYPADHRGPEQRGRGEVDGVLWRSKIFLLTPDPNADPFCAKPPWSGESTTSGFCPFQSQKWPKSAVPQRMEKSTAAHNPEVGGSSPPPATREKPSDCKALRPRSLGFLFAWRGKKRDFSGTVPLICCAVGIKERPRHPRPGRSMW